MLFIHLPAFTANVVSIEAQAVQKQQKPGLTGSYSGYVLLDDGTKKVDVGLTITALGEDEYEATLYLGKLPGEQPEPSSKLKTFKLHGTYTDYTLRLTGDFPLVFQFIHNRYTALDENNNYRGHLEKVIRVDSNY